MAVADAPSSSAPTPEECTHPQPVVGVMAHEFSHYDGAIGPEGRRRTVTYYGPVVGGLPIDAWYCEVCGLLRLDFPDGRKEERRLFPGPQPGLIAELSAVAPEKVLFGLQPRVSGLSVQPRVIEQLVAEAGFGQTPMQLPRLTLPVWDGFTWIVVTALSGVAFALLALGILAVYTTSTPAVVRPLSVIVSLSFTGILVIALARAALHHFFHLTPPSPSVAVTARGTPALDPATRTAVTMLVLSVLGLFAAGILAVYWYATPGAEWPVFLASLALAVVGALVKVLDVAWRHFAGGRRQA